jgi:hypothetical protein
MRWQVGMGAWASESKWAWVIIKWAQCKPAPSCTYAARASRMGVGWAHGPGRTWMCMRRGWALSGWRRIRAWAHGVGAWARVCDVGWSQLGGAALGWRGRTGMGMGAVVLRCSAGGMPNILFKRRCTTRLAHRPRHVGCVALRAVVLLQRHLRCEG